MSKKMLMNATQHEENRVAIVEDGILTELDIEVAGHEPTKGNIYRAVVVRVESGLQAAFVDYGAGRLGFLQIDEINYKAVKPDYQPAEDGRRPRITDLLYRGQELLVQIIKEERGTKGAALTTYLSLAGRYMVIMPGSQTRGVSRKAESDSQRKELKQAMASIDMADNVGYIVRTAALNQSREELERDYLYLIRLYESILDLDKKVKAPALLYKESNLIIRSIRDYFTTDMDEVLIDDQQVFKEARDFFQMVMPDQVKLVKLHQERRPIFSRYQIEDQIEILSRNKVPLPSGGSIVIDPTEALVAIDVNSGKMASEQGVEATATKTNIEAAKEVGRQLRLRDLGGLVVIDFIDMRDRKHAREVEKELKKSLENDKARVSVGRISQFGLLEMSRQRIKGALAEGTYLTCPHCQGNGRLKSPETQAAALLRKIHASAAKGQISQINAELPIDVASYLLNDKREDLVEMERDHNLQIHIHGNRDFHADQAELEIVKKEKDQPEQHEFVAAGLLSVPDEESSQEKNGGNAPKEEGNANKKRRRRRRRKPAATSEETQVAQQDTANLQAEASDSEHKEEAEPKKQPEQQEAPAAEQQKKPQRPRRSRSRTKKPEQPADEKVTTDKASPVQEESEKSVQEEKPKRQPGRRKPKAASESQPTEEETKKLEKDAEQPASESQEVTKKPQPRRRHRTPKRTAQADESKSSSENNQGGSETPKEAEEPTEQKKPARRGRRKSTAANKEQPSEDQAVSQNQAAETTLTDENRVEEKKSTRRPSPRRPRKTSTAKQTEHTGNEKATDATSEEKPKPRRGRPRKKPDSPENKEARKTEE